jgi:hypothetical protein
MVQECPHCHTKVLPKQDGRCPACRKFFSDPSDVSPGLKKVEESYDKKQKLDTRSSTLRTLLWFLMSFSLFILCLFYDGFYIAGDNPRAWDPGWELLINGWLGLIAGASGLPWLANPLLMIAWFMYGIKKNVISFLFSLSALSLMVSFLSVKGILRDEAGHYSQITGYGLGYWYWISSAFVILIANIFELLLTRRKNNAS